jgi:hypothetical protein
MKQIQQALLFQKPKLGGAGGSVRGSASQLTVGGLLNSCQEPTMASTIHKPSMKASTFFDATGSQTELATGNKLGNLARIVDTNQKTRELEHQKSQKHFYKGNQSSRRVV